MPDKKRSGERSKHKTKGNVQGGVPAPARLRVPMAERGTDTVKETKNGEGSNR